MQQEILARWIGDVEPLPPHRLNEYIGYTDPYFRVWSPGMVRFHLQRTYPGKVKGRGRLNEALLKLWRRDATRDPNLFNTTATLMRLAAGELDPKEKERLTIRLFEEGHPVIVSQVRHELEAMATEQDAAAQPEALG